MAIFLLPLAWLLVCLVFVAPFAVYFWKSANDSDYRGERFIRRGVSLALWSVFTWPFASALFPK